MKRLSILIVLPVFMFALERVNLIKNGSFEEEGIWEVTTGASGFPNPAVGTDKDDTESVTGMYSASADTREEPTWKDAGLRDSVAIYQQFIASKKLSDLDSLFWKQLVYFKDSEVLTNMCIVGFTYDNPERNGFGYGFINPQGIGVDNWLDIPEYFSVGDTVWRDFSKSLQADFVIDPKVDTELELKSFVMIGWGVWRGLTQWMGQKIHWDDIRLMGYADYDVGVKEILSPDEIGPCEELLFANSSASYIPSGRIKNFGREDATDFLIVADILDGEQIIYTDTVTHSLTADTEDTVSFQECVLEPPVAETYTLAIHTIMDPDECEEDDQMSKTLTTSTVSETPSVAHLDLEITNTLTSSLRVAYSIPANQTGTISIFDPSGRRVHAQSVTGTGELNLNTQMPSGVYIIRLESGKEGISKKAVVLR